MKENNQKTLIITGATGFLGSRLVKKMISLGFQVGILIRDQSNLARITSIQNKIFIEKDIKRLFAMLSPVHAVIHCATNYGRGEGSLREVLNTNINFSLDLLQKSLEAKVENFINTDSVLPAALNAYALSKQQFKEWGQLVSRDGGIRFINLRFEHFYGAGDDQSKFTTQVVQACLSEQKKFLLTKGEQQRDFIYIEDAIEAYVVILDKVDSLKVGYNEYDVGCGTAVTIRHFVETVKCVTKSNIVFEFSALPYRQYEMMESSANIEPLQKLGWVCKYKLIDGIQAMKNDLLTIE